MASNAEVTLYFCRSGEDNSGVEGIPVPLDFDRDQLTYYFEDVVDNATNDAYFLRGAKLLFPDD